MSRDLAVSQAALRMVRPPELFPGLLRCVGRRRRLAATDLWYLVTLIRWLQRRSGDVVERHRFRKGRQVVRAHVRDCLESGSKLDESRLAERGPEEADSHWRSEHHGRRHLHDRIT